MSNLSLTFQELYKGVKATAVSDDAIVVDNLPAKVTDGIINGYGVKKGFTTYLTGYVKKYAEYPNLSYYQTSDNTYIEVDSNYKDWSFSAPENYAMPPRTQAEAQKVVNKMLANDAIILCNNLFCARYADKLTKEEREQVRTLQYRLQARQEILKSDGYVRDIQISYPVGFSELAPYLEKLMNTKEVSGVNQIGIAVSTIVYIVIACVVLAAFATVAYYKYLELETQSGHDVKFSQELAEKLQSKLTEEEYQQLLNETKGIVTKARLKQMLGSYWDVIKYAALAFAGFALYRYLKNRKN